MRGVKELRRPCQLLPRGRVGSTNCSRNPSLVTLGHAVKVSILPKWYPQKKGGMGEARPEHEESLGVGMRDHWHSCIAKMSRHLFQGPFLIPLIL